MPESSLPRAWYSSAVVVGGPDGAYHGWLVDSNLIGLLVDCKGDQIFLPWAAISFVRQERAEDLR